MAHTHDRNQEETEEQVVHLPRRQGPASDISACCRPADFEPGRPQSPRRYGDRPAWTAVMKGAISRKAACFNRHRMMRRYATEAYLG